MITEDDIIRILGKRLKKESMGDIAKDTGVSKSFISNVYNRKVPVSQRLANALGYVRKTIFIKKGE